MLHSNAIKGIVQDFFEFNGGAHKHLELHREGHLLLKSIRHWRWLSVYTWLPSRRFFPDFSNIKLKFVNCTLAQAKKHITTKDSKITQNKELQTLNSHNHFKVTAVSSKRSTKPCAVIRQLFFKDSRCRTFSFNTKVIQWRQPHQKSLTQANCCLRLSFTVGGAHRLAKSVTQTTTKKNQNPINNAL